MTGKYKDRVLPVPGTASIFLQSRIPKGMLNNISDQKRSFTGDIVEKVAMSRGCDAGARRSECIRKYY